MSSGGLLLLLGLLTLWEVLTPVSSKDRPKFYELPADIGPCEDFTGAFHYSPREHEYIEFIYGGCEGNANNFNTLEECESSRLAFSLKKTRCLLKLGISMTNEETLLDWIYSSNLTQRPCFCPGPPWRPSPKPHPGLIPSSLQ